MHYDVVVVGAGVAGSLAAARISAGGRRVLLLQEKRPERPRVGEFLSSKAKVAIDCLAVLESGWEQEHADAGEFVSCWGSLDPVTRNFLFDPFGQSLILNRSRFDQSLVRAARRSGAKLSANIQLASVTQSSGSWSIVFNGDGVDTDVTSSFLIMCGGRAARRVPVLQTRRDRVDKLVCLGMKVANYQGDRRPSIEAYENGWAYSVGLPTGDLTESDSQSNLRISNSPEFLLREIAACPIARSRALRSFPTRREHVETFAADASSARTRPATGRGWCFAGDQAQSMDPLSSSGILQAARHAKLISDGLLRASSLEAVDLAMYAAELDTSYESYLAARKSVYGLERRWSSSFWLRRSRLVSSSETAA
jgi:flavin-dependent dehydrogenase